jgi:hypothetical protein
MRTIIGPAALVAGLVILVGFAGPEADRHRYFHLTEDRIWPVKGHVYDRVEMVWEKTGCFHHYTVKVSVRRDGRKLEARLLDAKGAESRRVLALEDIVALNANLNYHRAQDGMGASTNHHALRVSWYEGDVLRDREAYHNSYPSLSRFEGESIERFLARVTGKKR